MRTRTRLSWLSLLPLSLLWAAPVLAHPRGPNVPYEVNVTDAAGRELPTFHHEGQTFVLGSYGDRYQIRVENHTGRRVEAVVSVDGRDAVSGRIGDYVHGRGYLIGPYDRVVIDGFRQSLDQVAAFRFTRPGDSYSARMGTPENVGVIGVAIFPERVRPAVVRQPPSPVSRYDASPAGEGAAPRKSASRSAASAAQPAPSADEQSRASLGAPAPSVDNLGTAYGESLSSAAREVAFTRASRTRPAQIIALRYDDRAGLLARGIELSPHPRLSCGPQAFPRNNRFAPPPPPVTGD